MLDGRYRFVSNELARCTSIEETDNFWGTMLEGMPADDVENWDLRPLYEACEYADEHAGRSQSLTEAIGTSSFPQAISGLIAKRVLQAYEDAATEFPYIGDQLVQVEKTKLKEAKELRYSDHPLLKLTHEREASQPFETGEEYFEYKTAHLTREIAVTEEMVMFDQTNKVWNHCKNLGEAGRLTREYLILDTFIDVESTHILSELGVNYRGYRPSGTATDIWSTSAPSGRDNSGNSLTNALEGWNDLQNADDRLAQFYDNSKEGINDQSNPGKIMGAPLSSILVLPGALRYAAFQIMGTPQGLFDAEGTINPAGKGGPLHKPYIWSPILDNNSASTWYYGQARQAMKLKEVYPFRMLTKNKDQSLEMMRHSLYGWVKGESYMGCAWYTNKKMVRCTA